MYYVYKAADIYYLSLMWMEGGIIGYYSVTLLSNAEGLKGDSKLH